MNDVLPYVLPHKNLIGAVVCALFSVLLNTRFSQVGWRDYVLIVVSALIATAVVDYWFLQRGFFFACAIGFVIGYLADDVILNLNATVPSFVSGSLNDILDWLRQWLRRLLNK